MFNLQNIAHIFQTIINTYLMSANLRLTTFSRRVKARHKEICLPIKVVGSDVVVNRVEAVV